jgi:hypothetical protein
MDPLRGSEGTSGDSHSVEPNPGSLWVQKSQPHSWASCLLVWLMLTSGLWMDLGSRLGSWPSHQQPRATLQAEQAQLRAGPQEPCAAFPAFSAICPPAVRVRETPLGRRDARARAGRPPRASLWGPSPHLHTLYTFPSAAQSQCRGHRCCPLGGEGTPGSRAARWAEVKV